MWKPAVLKVPHEHIGAVPPAAVVPAVQGGSGCSEVFKPLPHVLFPVFPYHCLADNDTTI